jgi:tetratricopeptide (TPR) repeat protein
MEAEASGTAPTGEASALLRRQSLLIEEQIGLARNERFRNRIRSVRDIAIAAMVVVLLLVAGTVVWSASRTTGLVIQPFTVPPELVEDGLDGRAVAALFQDELVRLDSVSASVRPAASFRNDWSEAITVEVEAGGLSLTDAYTSLTRWLGEETYVSGGIRQTTTGLELVVRSSDGTAVTVQGPADQPEALMRQAAEQVYEQTQPYRYSQYLVRRAIALPAGPEQQDKLDRSRAILTRLLDSPSRIDRVWAYNGLAIHRTTSLLDVIPTLQAALEIDPEHPNILGNGAAYAFLLGQTETSLGFAQRLVDALSNPVNRAKVSEDQQQLILLESQARVAELEGDQLKALNFYTRLVDSDQRTASEYRDDRVNALIALHQPSALQRLIEEEQLRASERSGSEDPLLFSRARAAEDLEQWPQALAFLEAGEAQLISTLPPSLTPIVQTLVWPPLAYTRARTGDLAGAQALIAATPLDCYPCVRQRARIAELAGDRPAADRWSAEARRQGPSLPFAFAERGQMLMARGDTAGAIAFYEQAIERGPRWADPQKYWGDALMAQGDEAGAIRRYRAAADRAPRWGALHLAWGRALEAQGRRDQAREKYTEAARMDLSAADRAEVVRRLGVRPG